MRFLAQLYTRRIVNVNVNVITAGILAMGITVGVLHLADRWGLLAWLQSRVGNINFNLAGRQVHLVGQKLVISGMTFFVDVISDILVYYALHWLANHLPRRLGFVATGAYAHLSFIRDATLVQFERGLLSPLLYLVALGTQNTLLHRGWAVEPATAIGLGLGILMSRCIHTLWMIRQERRAAKKKAELDAMAERAAPAGATHERERHKASA